MGSRIIQLLGRNLVIIVFALVHSKKTIMARLPISSLNAPMVVITLGEFGLMKSLVWSKYLGCEPALADARLGVF